MLAGAARGEKGTGSGQSRVRLVDVDIGRMAGLKNELAVSASGNLTWLLLLPFSSQQHLLTLVSLLIQLMKATVLAESSSFHLYLPKLL